MSPKLKDRELPTVNRLPSSSAMISRELWIEKFVSEFAPWLVTVVQVDQLTIVHVVVVYSNSESRLICRWQEICSEFSDQSRVIAETLSNLTFSSKDPFKVMSTTN